MAHLRRVTARFRSVPQPVCQTLNEHDQGAISMNLSMRAEPTVDGPELHANRALCSALTLRSTHVIHLDVKVGS